MIVLHGMAFAFPTPFERGDILIVSDRVNNGNTFVLDNLPTWDGMKCAEQRVRDGVSERADRALARLIKDGDASDMCAYHYILLEEDLAIYHRFLSGEYLKETLNDAGIPAEKSLE